MDAGVCEYQPGEMRSYSRGTRAHNTLTVGDADQCEFWKAFRVGRRARPRVQFLSRENDRFIFEGSHDGFSRLSGQPIHRRRIEAGGPGLKIEDRVEGGDGQKVQARFLCHPDNDVFLKGDLCYIKAGDVEVRMETEAAIEIQDAWYMPDFGVCRVDRQIVVTYGRAPCRGGVHFTLIDQSG